MEYMVVRGGPSTTEAFDNKVNELMAKGWSPQGGYVMSEYHIAQAMIRSAFDELAND